MRGRNSNEPSMFFAINVEDRVAADHPLRPIRRMVDEELARLTPVFAAAYSSVGRPSVPPERLLKAMLLQCLYSIRSERQLVEQIDTRAGEACSATSCSAGSAAWTRPSRASTPRPSRTTGLAWRNTA